MPVVWSDEHRLHQPGGEVWIGVRIPGDEVPERAETIRDALTAAGAQVVAAAEHADDALLRVHEEALAEFLRGAWSAWDAEGYPEDPGQDRVVGYIFPTPGLLSGLDPALPVSPSARTGMFAFDTTTPVGPGTWQAARAAVDCALTAADLVLGGESAAYACTRPPGHHVTRSAYGGSCYLNSAAAAAAHVRAAAAERVAILDVDAHHGNGAQAIFADDPSVLTLSVHADPAQGWFPHYYGFAGDRAEGNLNVPLAEGTEDEGWLRGLDELVHAARAHDPDVLVVPLGVDAGGDDPESPFAVTAAGFRETGRRLGALELPTVFVQEGGYELASLGGLVLAVLEGFEEARG
jgi:acetoin utilization deacetylase AcuC-like enzyme